MKSVAELRWRWVVLLGYTLIAMSSQMIWLNFAGIATPQVTTIYHTNLVMIGLMAALWPLIFIPLAIPVGILVDKVGFKLTVTIGGVLLALFSWLRIIAGCNFYLLLIFQSLASTSQPFIFNSITKLANNWFPPNEQTLANGVGTMGQIIGMVLALIITPVMVPVPSYHDLVLNIIVFSLVSTISLLFFVLTARESPTRHVIREVSSSQGPAGQLRDVIRQRNIVILMILFFIGVGVFSALAQWMESILYSRGIAPLYGDIVGMSMLISGILGMVIISYISDKYHVRKRIILINISILTLLLAIFSLNTTYLIYLLVGIGIGFLLVSLAPVGLQLSLETVGGELAGTAAGLLWLLSQVGAFVIIIAMSDLYYYSMFLGKTLRISYFLIDPWFLSIIFILMLNVIALLLSLFLIEPKR
jgi:MFS family permease